MLARRLRTWTLLTMTPLLMTAGCGLFGSRPAPVSAPVEVAISASDRLNPDEQGQPLPTVVLIYQVKAAAKLESSEFEPLYRRPKEVLGEDLLHVEELTLLPGQTVRRQLDGDAAARAIAVVGIFRRPSGYSWRAIAEFPPGARRPLTFAVEGYHVERR